MAKEEMISVPREEWEAIKRRLDAAEARANVAVEAVTNSRAKILDPEYEAWKLATSRSAKERTQEIADKKYPDGKPFNVRLDSTTEDGKPGPNVSEHFPLTVRGNSDLEAKARYQELMGILKTDYKIVAEPATQAA